MEIFAKLYQAEDTGQVLVMLDSGDDGPEVQFHIKPPGLGVCQINMGFKDTDEGWAAAETAFSIIEEEKALAVARDALAGPLGILKPQEA